MRPVKGLMVVALALTAAVQTSAGVLLQPYEAPEWSVSEWINADPGPLRNQRGRVVIIEFFQLWCPGCNEFSIPLMRKWDEKWADRDDVLVVSIHTVFEGHSVQTPARLRAFVREKQIRHPVGIDKYATPDAEVPITMDRFHTGGTPHVAIIDQEGDLRFSHFGRFDAYAVEAFIERLLKEGQGSRTGARANAPGSKTQGNRNPGAQARGAARDPAAAQGDSVAKRAVERRRAGRRGLPPRRNPAAEGEEEDAEVDDGAEEAADDSDAGPGAMLSGTYQMQLQQSAKTCGAKLRPQNVPLDLTVDEQRIVARFKQKFLGLDQLTARYDPATGDFSTETMRRTDEDGVGVTLNLQLSGNINQSADPPTLQFQFKLDKEGDEPGWECEISGLGSATRSAGSAGAPTR